LDIDNAIKACKEEKSNVIPGRKQKRKDKGNLSEDYCDLSGDVGELVRLGVFNVLISAALTITNYA